MTPRRITLPLLAASIIACAAVAADDLRHPFELADVHPSDPASAWAVSAMRDPTLEARHGELRGGRFEIHSATLVDLISTAYAIDAAKLIGGHAWLDTARFDVIAKVPEGTTTAAIPGMLQALLAGRFHLSAHRDTSPFPEFVLTAGPHPTLKTHAGGGEAGCKRVSASGDTAITCSNVSMTEFAQDLPRLAGDYLWDNSLIDQTQISGSFDFALRWTPRKNFYPSGGGGVPLADAIEKQLGLNLTLRDVPEPVLVVDHADQVPTPNSPAVAKELPAVPLAFEVAIIKPTPPEFTERNFRREPGGRVTIEGLTLKSLIKFAWDYQDMEVIDDDDLLSGAPKFSESVRYDVVARAPATGPTDREAMQLMLRALLADRFGLKTHVETRSITVSALVAAKPHLQRADPRNRSGCRNIPTPPSATGFVPVFTIRCRNTTMAQFAQKLQPLAGQYVTHPPIDMTELTGAWDFTLNWSPPHLVDSTMPSDPNGSISLLDALDKQLGLRVKTMQHVMPVTVIDHLNPTPTPN